MNIEIARDKLLTQGFCVYPFPESIQKEMNSHICKQLGDDLGFKLSSVDSMKSIESELTSIHDDEYVKYVVKAKRNFPSDITKQVLAWTRELFNNLLGVNYVDINKILEKEIDISKGFTADSLSVYWRCVRPFRDADIGFAHRDSTGWNIECNEGYDPNVEFKYEQLWKIWLPLYGCEIRNSLQVVPSSHKEEIAEVIEITQWGNKPALDPAWLKDNEDNFITPSLRELGECIIFDYNLVHRGPLNKSEKLRQSAEYTILVKD